MYIYYNRLNLLKMNKLDKLESFESEFIDSDGTSSKILDNILRGIYELGFERPTGVQKDVIVPLIKGYDTIVQANSGMGKTGAFVIGGLHRIDWSLNKVQLLILEPTATLVEQTRKVVSVIGKYCCDYPVDEWLMSSYGGGKRVSEEVDFIRSGKCKIVVGTPGRISHLMRIGVFGPHLRLLILDEVDNLLDEHFLGDIHDILVHVPSTIQIGTFSATMSEQSLEYARLLVRKDVPVVEILLETEQVSLKGIQQYKVELGEIDNENSDTGNGITVMDRCKLEVLFDLYQRLSVAKSIIFSNSRKKAEWIGKELLNNNYTVGIIHGELDRMSRIRVEKEYRENKYRILSSSDLSSRGFDVQDLALVINFDVPHGSMAVETYIHRVGRTGRYGRKGMSITLVRSGNKHEQNVIETINSKYGGNIVDLPSDIFDTYTASLGL